MLALRPAYSIHGPACSARLQERAEELAAREETLEAWKAQLKSEAVRQIAEREQLLTEWQARLDRRQAEIEDVQRAAEVGGGRGVVLLPSSCGCCTPLQLHYHHPARHGPPASTCCLAAACCRRRWQLGRRPPWHMSARRCSTLRSWRRGWRALMPRRRKPFGWVGGGGGGAVGRDQAAADGSAPAALVPAASLAARLQQNVPCSSTPSAAAGAGGA